MKYEEINYNLKILNNRLVLINRRLRKLESATKGVNKYDEIQKQQEEKILNLRITRELKQALYKYKPLEQVNFSKKIYSSLEDKNKSLYT